MTDAVLTTIDGPVATITLNRPDALNSATVELKEQLLAALAQVRDDESVRAVVITGAGRAFCGGQDLREHAAALDSGDGAAADTVRAHYNPIALGIATMPKPVVAAVNGMAAGAGASMAFAADFRLAADSAAFLLAFTRVGLGPDTGASWTLQRLVGTGRATAMLMLAEPVSADQALEMGLVNAVVPGDALAGAADELARRLAAGPTLAYAAVKTALATAATSDLPTALDTEARLQAQAFASMDHRNATKAFIDKTRPVFEGR